MTDDNTPSDPTEEGGGDDAGGSTTDCPEKCWPDDYEKKISINSYGRYFKNFKKDGTEHVINGSEKFKILVPIKSGNKITVEVRFKQDPQSGLSAADKAGAISKLENAVKDWNNVFKLEVDDPDCGKKVFDIEYKLIWVTSGEDYTMKIHPTYPRAGLTGNVLDVSNSRPQWTYTHEFAHCLGLPDEYSYTSEDETVRYFKPDGTMDSAITAPPGGKPSSDPTATIMTTHGNKTRLKRHGWNIAIETQELLRAKLGRQVKCDIIQP